ncbi:MAG: dual specificity protein phosphatase family protein [Anaerolineae bacterium]|nr:dual specificity protein phosphatase family protein [Anaerolineae bacterium]
MLTKPVKTARKGIRIVNHRLRTQGLRTTLIWIYGRGVPKLTGVPLLRYSRITPTVYVGPQYGQRGKRRLENAGIHAGVNLRTEFDDAVHGLALAHYCHLPTEDDTAPTIEHLDEGVAFMQRMIADGQKVYIHCAGGVGRAPTLAAAYFIREGVTLDAALDLIRQARPFIFITPPQMACLREYEATYQPAKASMT